MNLTSGPVAFKADAFLVPLDALESWKGVVGFVAHTVRGSNMVPLLHLPLSLLHMNYDDVNLADSHHPHLPGCLRTRSENRGW